MKYYILVLTDCLFNITMIPFCDWSAHTLVNGRESYVKSYEKSKTEPKIIRESCVFTHDALVDKKEKSEATNRTVCTNC